MKTIIGHINTLDNKQYRNLSHHLVVYQLGRRYACEELLKNTPIDKILVTLALKFMPSRPYALSMLQQATHLLQASPETIQAYGHYLQEVIQDLDATTPHYQWWQEETGFFENLSNPSVFVAPDLEDFLKHSPRTPIFKVKFENEQLILHIPIYQIHDKKFVTSMVPIFLSPFSLKYLKKYLCECPDVNLSVELVWCGPEIYVLISDDLSQNNPYTPNRLRGEWRWVRSPVTKVATATILTLQGIGISALSSQAAEKTMLVENPLLPKKIIPPTRTPVPQKTPAPAPPKATAKPPSPVAVPTRKPQPPQRVIPKRVIPKPYVPPKRTPTYYPRQPLRGGTTYIVSRGETLSSIAQNILGNAALWSNIYALNRSRISNPHHIRSGQRIVLPSRTASMRPLRTAYSRPRAVYRQPVSSGRVYRVRYGDSLWNIAYRQLGNAYRWPAIYRLNRHRVRNPNVIYPGQRLVLPV